MTIEKYITKDIYEEINEQVSSFDNTKHSLMDIVEKIGVNDYEKRLICKGMIISTLRVERFNEHFIMKDKLKKTS